MKRHLSRLYGGVFAPKLIPSLMALVLFVTLVTLGTWQLQRLYWKEALITRIEASRTLPPVDVTTSADEIAAPDYRAAKVTGLFQYDKELYLSAISLTGEGGYHVLTPLQLEEKDARVILVDRGWVPYALRDPVKRPESRLTGEVTVTGVLRLPQPKSWLMPYNDPAANDWYSIDVKAMSEAAGLGEMMPYILEADATPNVGGYPIGGQTRFELPNNHLGYAITWYSLALVLVVVYLAASRQRIDGE